MTNPPAATVEAVAELQLAAFLAGRGSVMQKGSAIKTVLKPAPSMDDFREMARASLTTQAVEPDILPCDVRLPPATTISAGCSFDTLRLALRLPDRPRKFTKRCPTCESPSPGLHPETDIEDEVAICLDAFHAPSLKTPEQDA